MIFFFIANERTIFISLARKKRYPLAWLYYVLNSTREERRKKFYRSRLTCPAGVGRNRIDGFPPFDAISNTRESSRRVSLVMLHVVGGPVKEKILRAQVDWRSTSRAPTKLLNSRILANEVPTSKKKKRKGLEIVLRLAGVMTTASLLMPDCSAM